MVLFLIAGIVLSGWLGIVGLIRGQLDLTYEKTLTGKSAKAASILCLSFSALMILLSIWLVMGAPGISR